MIRFPLPTIFFVLSMSQAALGTTPLTCIELLLQSGQVTKASDLRARLDDMRTYLAELESYHTGSATEAVVLSTPESARQLEAAWGPIISTTTFSRELDRKSYLQLSSHILGFLSGLPQGRAIIASGGTMGDRTDPTGTGGGVGMIQIAARQLGFKTMSITASAGFKYRAAPSDFLLFSMDGFGSESRMMYELSKVLVVIGGGGQAYNEAVEFLIYNPNGILVFIDDPDLGGSSVTLMNDSRFKEFASKHRQIIIAKTGSEAGTKLAEALGISSLSPGIVEASHVGMNIISPNADLHQLLPNSHLIGFSGWSNFEKSGPDVVAKGAETVASIGKAIKHIHSAIAAGEQNVFYATAGNDPKFATPLPPFETMVHELPASPAVDYIAITASKVAFKDLNPRVTKVSFVASQWAERTQQLVARLDAFITAGGNQAVIDQSIHAALLKRHHIHILGANTLTDLRIEKLKNPNLKVLTPAQILALDPASIRTTLGLKP
jgi:hypothetical protein